MAPPTLKPRPTGARITGCPWHDVKAMLRQVGLRPTRQRMALGWLLFGKGDRHLTAEMLYDEASRAKVPVSLATIYNTLHQFTEVGLLRQVAVDGSKAYFDTNTTDHHHFFVEGEDELLDIPSADVLRRPEPAAAGRLRDRPRRRGRAAAPQGVTPSNRSAIHDVVMAGLVPAIHVFGMFTTWMPGTRPDMRSRCRLCTAELLLNLLVRIGAPQPVLPDPAVKALAAEFAPGAGAGLQRAQHAGLQLRHHRGFDVGALVERHQFVLQVGTTTAVRLPDSSEW